MTVPRLASEAGSQTVLMYCQTADLVTMREALGHRGRLEALASQRIPSTIPSRCVPRRETQTPLRAGTQSGALTWNSVGLGRVELPTSRLSGSRPYSSDSGNFPDFKALPHDLHGIGSLRFKAFSA